jgi:cell division protein FtsA
MSETNDIIVGLDIGTTKVAAVIGQVREGGVEVIGAGKSPSYGLRKGIIVNIDSTVEAVTRAVEGAEMMAGVEVDSVFVGVGGSHIKGINTRGMVAISSRNREIGPQDVNRAVEAAKAIAIPSDREILHIFNQEFKVDDQDGIKDPVGMSGSRLEVEVHIVTASNTAVENIMKSVNRAGLKVNHIVLQSFASALAVMTDEEKELGEALIDFGGGTIDILMYVNGGIWHSGVIAVGGNNITNDIAIGMRSPAMLAEDIKSRFAVASRLTAFDSQEFEIPGIAGKESRKASMNELTDIVEPRMSEIFGLAKKELDSTGFTDLLAGGVMVTGGASRLKGLSELGEQVFGLPVRVSGPRNIRGVTDIVSDPSWSTATGLMLYGYQFSHEFTEDASPRPVGSLKSGVINFIKWLKEYF